MEPLYIIDASPIFYKSFFAIPMLNSKNGVPTNAAMGYSNTLVAFLKKYNPKHVAVCFDGRSKFRKDLYGDYKAERKPMSNDLYVQIPIIKNITEALGLSIFHDDEYEADDLIGMFTKLAEAEGREVIIISPDKDMCQLVNDKVKVLDLSKKVMYDKEKVKEKFGVEPHQIVDLLALCGDKVDGIPGVLGIGDGTAKKLIEKYGSVENIYSHIDEIKGAVQKKLITGKLSCEISKQLATILSENKTGIQRVDQLERGFVDKSKITSLFDALNFLSLKDKIQDLE